MKPAVANTVGFCPPSLPWSNGQQPNATHLLLGAARPQGAHISSTPFLSPSELSQVARKLQWNSTVEERMALRYLAVIHKVTFDQQSFAFTTKTGTANMDTGGGPVIGVPQAVAAAYYTTMARRASSLNMSIFEDRGYSCLNATQQPLSLTLARVVFPPMSFAFRGGATAVVSSENMIMRGYIAAGVDTYCSVVISMAGEASSVPTAFWPSQPFFRSRYTGFDRKLNTLLISDVLSCNKAKFVEP